MPKESKNNHEQQGSQQPVKEEMAQNPNPRANENIRVRSDEPPRQSSNDQQVGSEITDGEDA